jgi:hypothetical protein
MWSGLMLERLLAGQLEVQLGRPLAGQLLVRQLRLASERSLAGKLALWLVRQLSLVSLGRQ